MQLKPSRVSTVIAKNQHTIKVSTCRIPAPKPSGVMPRPGAYQTSKCSKYPTKQNSSQGQLSKIVKNSCL